MKWPFSLTFALCAASAMPFMVLAVERAASPSSTVAGKLSKEAAPATLPPTRIKADKTADPRPVYVIPIRDEIEDSIVYVVRRGIKEAVNNNAQAVILDMNTNGGRGDAMEEIMQLLEHFKGETITCVNNKAFSAGAFISVATKHIFMVPSSVIGAAAPILMNPTGGVEDTQGTIKKKFSSAYSALIRAAAERNGYNVAVVDAMVKETDGLTLDGKEIVKKGEILTLTVAEATALYGKPPKPLLAESAVKDLDEVFDRFGFTKEQIHRVESTGAEHLARFITMISPVLLLIGLAGIYLEVKTPGVMLPGIVAAIAFAIFFFGHYVAGLSGYEEIALLLFGLVLIGIEIFVLPGHVLPGFLGVVAILVAVLWAMVDKMPGAPGLPTMPQLQFPLAKLAFAMIGAGVLAALLVRWLPQSKGPWGGLILQTRLDHSAGFTSAVSHHELVGQKGIALSLLRPSGTGRFKEQIVDVVTRGDFIQANEPIVVKEVHGAQVIVEKA